MTPAMNQGVHEHQDHGFVLLKFRFSAGNDSDILHCRET